jgi:hypothetical protein
MNIPEAYVIQKLYSYAQSPTYHKFNKQYNAGCPVCKEGSSFGRKKRLYYYPDSNTFFCFNCNKNWNAYEWLRDACKMTFKEIKEEVNSNNYRINIGESVFQTKQIKQSSILPHNSIDLGDTNQLLFYKNNEFINTALTYINKRKLNTALNKPKTFFLSLTDFMHKNRLCIPFYDNNKKVIYYQTRALDNSLPAYLNKINEDKRVFGLDNIKNNIDHIFIFEGPIDAMFVENGVAVTGLNLTDKQKEDLSIFPLHKKIWVPDNQHIDKAAKEKTDTLLSQKMSVFLWPENIKCKDFNELAILLNQNYISHKFILNNTKLF